MAPGSMKGHHCHMTDPSQLLADAGALVYLVVAGLVIIDAVLPIAPSETLLTAGGVLAASGELSIAALVVAGAAGALTGHALLYLAGRVSGSHVLGWLTRSQRTAVRADAAAEKVRERPWLLIVADFVPWGRTVLMYSAGMISIAPSVFFRCASIGAVAWASFYAALGWATGSVFESEWQGLIVSLAVAVSITALAEGIARLRRSTPPVSSART